MTLTIQPNIEHSPTLRAAQVAEAAREGYAWAQRIDRTQDQVIHWAGVILRDGPERMGWTPSQARDVALAYLRGWDERPGFYQRVASTLTAMGRVLTHDSAQRGANTD